MNFKRISGSKIWPSTDPNDSPFDTFVCICGWSFKQRIYGYFTMGMADKCEQNARRRMERHKCKGVK